MTRSTASKWDQEPVSPANSDFKAKTMALPAHSARRHRLLVWAAMVVSGTLAGCASVMVATCPTALSATDLQGQRIFRYDTFGDEQKWTDQLRLHEIVDKM